jgi:hypothetical protein
MTLFRGRSDEFASQRILAELGDIRMEDIFATPEGCHSLGTVSFREPVPVTHNCISDFILNGFFIVCDPQAIRLFTSRNGSSSTDYYIGSTRTVINRQKESFGLANVGSVDDMCLAESSSLSDLRSFISTLN